ncbi:class I adenylate-forming enzyme family protein [Ramlibacter albus]|uniref:AMP-binding protein n=1 Tax=Ramlibacter albus TaxID=2079448 RepID=A0A923M567_9BURK|nr:AMP-binding protein [Ramlibacter albus]MBC5763029.1 AMP-binding protein [Ramlibacter albus]
MLMLPRDLIRNCAAAYPCKAAYHCGNISRTWQEMDARSDKLAAGLQSMGVAKGDAVAILSHECVEIYEHFMACMKIGAVRVGVNWRYPPAELSHVLHDSGARVLLVQASCVHLLGPLRHELESADIRLVGYAGAHGLACDYDALVNQDVAPTLPALDADDPLLFTYTSGTTGKPKGVVITNGSVSNTIFQSIVGRGLRTDDVFYMAGQSSWMTVIMLVLGLGNGMTHVIPDGDFDVASYLLDVERFRVTAASLVPTMMRRAIQEQRANPRDTSSLRVISYGSAPATPGLIRDAYETFGCEMLQAYGMTEAGWVTHLTEADHRYALAHEPELLGSAGRVGVTYELTVRDEQGNVVPAGQRGEIWIRGQGVMKGYLNLPTQTAEVMRGDWLCTNDIGRVDSRGYLYLLDRKKFLIITGAVNVFPAMVEAVLSQHPAVADVAVFGVPHPEWGEAVVAVVQRRLEEPAAADATDLLAFCQQRLSKPECPKAFVFMPEIPKASTGKTNKLLLKQQVLAKPEQFPWVISETRWREG